MNTTTAVIGATGKTGRRVADLLEERGLSVRRLARGTTPGFDWDRPEGWRQALDGVDRLYATYVPDLAVPESAAAITRFIEVARDAGVRHIVLLSGRGEDGARRCEEILFASGHPGHRRARQLVPAELHRGDAARRGAHGSARPPGR